MRFLPAFAMLVLAGCSVDDLTHPPLPPDLRMPMFPTGCMSGVQDGDETDVDCGGSCPACDSGRMCSGAKDCASGFCTNRVCDAPKCDDGVKNGMESDVDCGAFCPSQCAEGKRCGGGSDCQSMTCVNEMCGKSPCFNNKLDGMETDVDCGGPICSKCGDGKMCSDGGDCNGGMCINQVCKSPLNCMAGTGDCDGNVDNGCEALLGTDAKNCGRCGNVCAANTPYCSAGKCSADDFPPIYLLYLLEET